MGIEQYSEGRETPGRKSNLSKFFSGIGSFFERRPEPSRSGVELYNEDKINRLNTYIPDPLELISPKSYDWMERNIMGPAAKSFAHWTTKTIPESFQEWNESYVRPVGPISGDVSRDWGGQIGDIGKWLVNTPATWGMAVADVATDVGEASVAMLPEWAGGEGRSLLFSKEQKYRWDAAAVDKFGIQSLYKDNPYVKYDWDNWDKTKKSNPILKEVQDSTYKHMYENFLTKDVEGGIWDEIISETGYGNLMGKTREDQSDLFEKKFFEMYRDDWDMNWKYESDRIMKRDYDLGGKGTPGAIEEFEIGFNYDPLLPYSTGETGFLEGSTRGLGQALMLFGGPGTLSKGRKFVPKWKKKHLGEGIMGAARGTKYGDPEPWAAPEYLRVGSR